MTSLKRKSPSAPAVPVTSRPSGLLRRTRAGPPKDDSSAKRKQIRREVRDAADAVGSAMWDADCGPGTKPENKKPPATSTAPQDRKECPPGIFPPPMQFQLDAFVLSRRAN